ncbi:MAG: polysaccharide deacetylase [Sphingobacteriales bacterium]|nr:MAG: polysaccharide deacetylase [Sphingobacteriales bacterium]
MEGIFTISLDYELHWGVFDKRDRDQRKQCYLNTKKLVPELLQIFDKHDVHVTWATVGALFAKNAEEWQRLKPVVEPDYIHERYSAYNWVQENGLPSEKNWAHFSPDEVKMIQQYDGQELATHTFGHYYCMEPNDNPQAFAADLDAANKAAEPFNAPMVSMVFPRNQFNDAYLKICYDKGIRTVRSNPDNWFWTPVADGSSGLMRKVFRTGDGYMSMGKRTSYGLSTIKKAQGEPLQLPASRLLRSWSPKYQFTNTLRLKRILNEMRGAAKNGECYHLWWHPENFGDHPQQNMADLKVILDEYTRLKSKYGMRSWNMGEYIKFV